MTYTARTFDLPELKGLSKEQITLHLSLYEGYVKHTNLIMEKIAALKEADAAGNAYLINELRRRLGFEFDGMRMHEYYFEQFEDGAKAAEEGSGFSAAAKEKYGDWDSFIAHVKEVAGTRGIGWVVVYHDARGNTLHTAWIDDHQLGQLAGLPVILALDLWEHAYMVDYAPKDKNLYVEAFLENVNWSIIEKRFEAAK
jgi:Fe-Mn family superoxide dismutase